MQGGSFRYLAVPILCSTFPSSRIHLESYLSLLNYLLMSVFFKRMLLLYQGVYYIFQEHFYPIIEIIAFFSFEKKSLFPSVFVVTVFHIIRTFLKRSVFYHIYVHFNRHRHLLKFIPALTSISLPSTFQVTIYPVIYPSHASSFPV